jgi:3-hydroxyacyl-[acyl-carrier-protein] dehydratase
VNPLPDPTDILPHRPPFLFVDRFESFDVGSGTATWMVDGSEDFLRGHFPGHPVVPGVLIVEALAQTAGLALASTAPGAGGGHAGFLAQIDVRFRAAARPPCGLTLRASRLDGLGTLHRFSVSAACGSDRVCEGVLVLSVPESAQDARTPR